MLCGQKVPIRDDAHIISKMRNWESWLPLTNSRRLYIDFCKSFQKEFDVKSFDTVDVYLGNEVNEVIGDNSKRKVGLSQCQ